MSKNFKKIEKLYKKKMEKAEIVDILGLSDDEEVNIAIDIIEKSNAVFT